MYKVIVFSVLLSFISCSKTELKSSTPEVTTKDSCGHYLIKGLWVNVLTQDTILIDDNIYTDASYPNDTLYMDKESIYSYCIQGKTININRIGYTKVYCPIDIASYTLENNRLTFSKFKVHGNENLPWNLYEKIDHQTFVKIK